MTQEVTFMRRLFALVLAFVLLAQFAVAETGSSAPTSVSSAVPTPAANGASITSPLPASEVKAGLDQEQFVIHGQSLQLEDQRKQIEGQQSEIEKLCRQLGGAQLAMGALTSGWITDQEQAAATSIALLNSNACMSTNSDTFHLRVYFADVVRGRREVPGARQSWSLLKPNRVGVSPFLSEIYNTLHLDSNYQV